MAYTPGKVMPPKNEFEAKPGKSGGTIPSNQYRIYKPLFLDPNYLKRDLDREFESISQALIWVTSELKSLRDENIVIKQRLTALEAKP